MMSIFHTREVTSDPDSDIRLKLPTLTAQEMPIVSLSVLPSFIGLTQYFGFNEAIVVALVQYETNMGQTLFPVSKQLLLRKRGRQGQPDSRLLNEIFHWAGVLRNTITVKVMAT
jgi:hypothetical protein